VKVPIALINPNTNEATTTQMVRIAHRAASLDLDIHGLTAAIGSPLITNESELATACRAVCALSNEIPQEIKGVIVSAFGDPGLAALQNRLSIPVVGIGEAGLREGALGNRRFSVVTTTPDLVSSIDRKVITLGLATAYAGVVLTAGDPIELTGNPPRLREALATAILRAMRERRVDAVVVGGGPLGDAALALASRFRIPIIEPIPAAVRLLEQQIIPTSSSSA
jgi:allantoin racemase